MPRESCATTAREPPPNLSSEPGFKSYSPSDDLSRAALRDSRRSGRPVAVVRFERRDQLIDRREPTIQCFQLRLIGLIGACHHWCLLSGQHSTGVPEDLHEFNW